MKKRNLKIISAITILTLAASITAPYPILNPVKAYAKEASAKIEVKLTEDANTTGSSISPKLTVTNTSDEDISLKDLKLQYYYTSDDSDAPKEEKYTCYYSGTTNDTYVNLSSFVQGKIEKLKSPTSNADTSLIISFTDGVLKKGQSMMIQGAVNKVDWSSYDKSNDYSFGDSSKVTGTLNSEVVWGKGPIEETKKPEADYSKSSYLSFDESNIKDFKIPLKNADSKVSCIKDVTLGTEFSEGEDYSIDDNALILKEDFLKGYLNTNTVIGIQYKDGQAQNILIHNNKEEMKEDPLRSGINKDEAEISFSLTPDNKANLKNSKPNIVTITNTSNIDMDLSKLVFSKFYGHFLGRDIPSEGTPVDYAYILGDDEDLSSKVSSYYRPDGDDFGVMPSHYEVRIKKENKALKPGETLVMAIHFNAKGSEEELINAPESVISYDHESIYGLLPEALRSKPSIKSSDITVEKDEECKDTNIDLELNNDALSSIAAYSNDKLVCTLKRGTDYELVKRNELILKKSFLESLKDSTTNIDFAFESGTHCSINFINKANIKESKEGSISVKNEDCYAFCDTAVTGMGYNKWENLTVPIYLDDLKTENITEGNFTFNYDSSFFDDCKIEDYNKNLTSTFVNTKTGTINITFNDFYMSKDKHEPLVVLTLTPSKYSFPCVDSQKLSMSDDSYYITAEGEHFKPKESFNYFNLLSSIGTANITSHKTEVTQGEKVAIPVTIDKYVKFYNLGAIDWNFTYDGEVFDDVSIIPGDILSNEPGVFETNTDNEKCRVSCIYNKKEKADYKVSEEGVLFYIVVKVKKNAPIGKTSFKFEDKYPVEYYFYNDNFMPCNIGEINIGDITINQDIQYNR